MRLKKSMKKISCVLVAVVALAGANACDGELGFEGDHLYLHPPETPPEQVDMDTFPQEDLFDPGPGDPIGDCTELVCGENATCMGGVCRCNQGYSGDPFDVCAPLDACSGVECPFGASCLAGECRCDVGFSDDNVGGCVPDPVSETSMRPREEVCERWIVERPPRASETWLSEPTDNCDPGTLHPDFHQDAIRRVTLFRWLVGLEAVTSLASARTITQACASTLAARGMGLTHTITSDFPCYSQEAASGAASSNIARGISRAADSVDLYIFDLNVESLGHRRWVFFPRMGATGFGYRDGYSCMYAFDNSGSSVVPFVAYPAPGYFPFAALGGAWSISGNIGINNNATVQVVRVSDMQNLTITRTYVPGGSFGDPTLAWEVADAVPEVEYEVRIQGLTGPDSDITYRVTLANCSQ